MDKNRGTTNVFKIRLQFDLKSTCLPPSKPSKKTLQAAKESKGLAGGERVHDISHSFTRPEAVTGVPISVCPPESTFEVPSLGSHHHRGSQCAPGGNRYPSGRSAVPTRQGAGDNWMGQAVGLLRRTSLVIELCPYLTSVACLAPRAFFSFVARRLLLSRSSPVHQSFRGSCLLSLLRPAPTRASHQHQLPTSTHSLPTPRCPIPSGIKPTFLPRPTSHPLATPTLPDALVARSATQTAPPCRHRPPTFPPNLCWLAGISHSCSCAPGRGSQVRRR